MRYEDGAVLVLPVPATWSASTEYINGNLVEQGGIRYRANWWTLNQSPATNNGPLGSGQPWTSQGACTSRTDETSMIEEATGNTANLADVLVFWLAYLNRND